MNLRMGQGPPEADLRVSGLSNSDPPFIPTDRDETSPYLCYYDKATNRVGAATWKKLTLPIYKACYAVY